MRDRLARRLVRLYPRAWRARYEDEFLALLDASGTGWRDLPDIARGVAREWLRLTPIGRGLGIALEMWLTAIVWSLAGASIGSLITGVTRLALGFESTLALPFLSVDVARSFVVEMPAAIASAALLATPWLLLVRRWRMGVRLAALLPFVATSVWFVLGAEQFAGVVAAGWILASRVTPRRSMESVAR